LELLPTRNLLFPGTHEILTYLRNKNYTLHIITNGFEDVQHRKMQGANLNPYFTHLITSEKANALKPHRAIFEHALSCSQSNAAESIMIGDSVEVDIKGAYDMGLDQVHMNHLDRNRYPIQGEIYPTHTLFHLEELRSIL
jgi:putative hydrolase of the HAD superfamily